MSMHQLQQTMTNTRRAIGAHGWGMGLSILLLAAALTAYRYTVPLAGSAVVVGASQAAPLGIDAPQGVNLRDLPTGLTDYLRPRGAEQPNQTSSAALGITLPYGANVHDLPFGITDYIRTGTQLASAAAVSSVLGIDLPTGTTRAGLPSGLTDYLRPAHAAPRTPAPAVSSVLGITLPYGANAYDLPAGITDYLRSDR